MNENMVVWNGIKLFVGFVIIVYVGVAVWLVFLAIVALSCLAAIFVCFKSNPDGLEMAGIFSFTLAVVTYTLGWNYGYLDGFNLIPGANEEWEILTTILICLLAAALPFFVLLCASPKARQEVEGLGKTNAPHIHVNEPSGGEFDYDPSRFRQNTGKPSKSTDVATVGTNDEETDERLWALAMDERTPESERQAAMRAIKKRGKGIPRKKGR